MSKFDRSELQLGYIPLLDSLPLIWANERGFFSDEGINISLVKEASWASLRDRLAFGLLDAAHCLSAMLPAAMIGADQIGIPLQTSLVLSESRAFISLSQKMCHQLDIHAHEAPVSSAQKVADFFNQGRELAFAHVFNHSIHHYTIREWLSLANPELAHRLRLRTLPPPYVVEALANHTIDGFCVGEPWNSQGEVLGLSHIICSSQDIIPPVADKVLATTRDWAQQNPEILTGLVKAILRAQNELRNLQDFTPVWDILSRFNIVQFQCSEEVFVEKFYMIQNIIKNYIQSDATPKQDDFHWLFQQMQKWNKVQVNIDQLMSLSASCINLDIYQNAYAQLN